MPPKKDKKKKAKPMKRTQQQKGKGQSQKQTQIVNINLGKSKGRSAPRRPPVSNIPQNMIRLNEPSTTLIAQPMVQPVREPLKEVVGSSQLLGSSVPVTAPVPESEPVKRKGGRPKGSKNKPKSAEEIGLQAMSQMRKLREANERQIKTGGGLTQRELEETIKKPAEKERPAFISPEPPIMELPKK